MEGGLQSTAGLYTVQSGKKKPFLGFYFLLLEFSRPDAAQSC